LGILETPYRGDELWQVAAVLLFFYHRKSVEEAPLLAKKSFSVFSVVDESDIWWSNSFLVKTILKILWGIDYF
jgi:hypothetical protein